MISENQEWSRIVQFFGLSHGIIRLPFILSTPKDLDQHSLSGLERT